MMTDTFYAQSTPELAEAVGRLRKRDLLDELHPVNTNKHASWDAAQEIVGHFHSKSDLIQVVSVLILVAQSAEARIALLEEALRNVLAWWPEHSESGRLDKGGTLATDIRAARSALHPTGASA